MPTSEQQRLASPAAKPAITPASPLKLPVLPEGQQLAMDAAATPAAEQQSRRSSWEMAHSPAWGGLMAELVVKIALCGGATASAQAMTHVCRWVS